MKIIKSYLHTGAKKPFCVLHSSDTHIALADNRDTDRKLELSERRKNEFPTSESDLDFLKEKAIKVQRTIIYTGDLIEKILQYQGGSYANFTDYCFLSCHSGSVYFFNFFMGRCNNDTIYKRL